MIVSLNNKFLPLEEAQISPFDRGFLFADGVYEAIRTYHGKLFKIHEHILRLKRSLKELKIDCHQTEEIEKIIYQLIEKNNLSKTDTLAYIQITRGVCEQRVHHFPKSEIKPTVFISVTPFTSNKLEQEKGTKAILCADTRWARCDIKSISLLPNVLANQLARESDSQEAILVKNGIITEGTHTSFFAIKNSELYTSPKSNLILGSITREIVLQLCGKLKIPFREKSVKQSDLKNFEEFFIAGTTTDITPVIQIDDNIIGNGKPGKITRVLQSAFQELTNSY